MERNCNRSFSSGTRRTTLTSKTFGTRATSATPSRSSCLSTRSSCSSACLPPHFARIADQLVRNDPNPTRGAQLPRAASLIIASLGFIHDLREGILEPDTIRGKIPLDMDQYTRLFGTARIPTEVCQALNGCVASLTPTSSAAARCKSTRNRDTSSWYGAASSVRRYSPSPSRPR